MTTLRPDKEQDFGGNALKNFNRGKTESKKPISQADMIRKLARKQSKDTPVFTSDGQAVKQADRQALRHSSKHSVGHSSSQTNKQSVEHSDSLIGRQSDGQSDRQSALDWMSTQQKKVFSFLVSNESRVTRIKDIQKATSVPYGTIRGSIKALVREKLISNPVRYRKGMFQGFSYVINESLKNKFEQSKPTDSLTDILTDSQSVGHSERHSEKQSSYKKDRKMFNNLSVYLENSDFWKHQGLSLQKCQSWIDEFSFCDSDMLLQQLQFAEFMDKVKTADNPISYFYKTLGKGGCTRPTGFEFPEERAERLQKEAIEIRQKSLASLEELREQEKELADKEAFYAFLADKESVLLAINEIEKQYVTPKFKISLKVYHDTGRIDSRLEARLKQYFLLD